MQQSSMSVFDAAVRRAGVLVRRAVSALMLGALGICAAAERELSAQGPVIGAPEVSWPCPSTVKTLSEQDPEGLGRTPAQQLTDLLSPWRGFVGTILIPSGMTVVLDVPDTPQSTGFTTRSLIVNSCVTIKGTRSGLDPGPMLVATNREVLGPIFEIVGQNVRIEGLRLRGPMTTDDRTPRDWSVHAIGISGDASNVQVDNNTFEFWSVGVNVFRGWPGQREEDVNCEQKAPFISITRNYFNRNAIENLGYGVGVFRGCARIEGNIFNKNRHAVAATGHVSFEDGTFGKGYIARYNYVLEGGFTESSYWNQHFDVHGTGSGGYGGTAGRYFLIASNTIRGEQRNGLTTRPAFMLRGRATDRALFRDNVVVHDDADEAVELRAAWECLVFTGQWEQSYEKCNLEVGPNRYDTDTRNELAVGDFDGDGRDDVFLANGTAWWYSSAGRTEWRFLQPSTRRVRDLRFGRFDGDARTDVLFSDGANWWVSMGGARLPTRLRSDGTPLRDCVFGDFDGNGRTDALRADGVTWSVSLDGSAPWVERRVSGVAARDLRVGDFTGDGIDDVFWIANNTWQLWDPDRNAWRRDDRKPVHDIDIDALVVADFDGDGRADLARTDGQGWSWLPAGTNTWVPLRDAGEQPEYGDIRSALLGRFTPITSTPRRLNAIRYASTRFPESSRSGFVLWYGLGRPDAFAPWTPQWQEMR